MDNNLTIDGRQYMADLINLLPTEQQRIIAQILDRFDNNIQTEKDIEFINYIMTEVEGGGSMLNKEAV